jgi:hypothetical protein
LDEKLQGKTNQLGPAFMKEPLSSFSQIPTFHSAILTLDFQNIKGFPSNTSPLVLRTLPQRKKEKKVKELSFDKD